MQPVVVPEARTSERRPMHPGRPAGEQQRRLLLGLVAGNPGVHVRRAACVLGLNWNSCLHHARRLEREGRMVLRKVGGRVCLFDRRQGSAALRLAPVLLRDERNQQLAHAILDHAGHSQQALASSLGLAASVVHRRLRQMEELGLVDRVVRGRECLVFGTEALQTACAPSVPDATPVPAHDGPSDPVSFITSLTEDPPVFAF